MNSELMKDYFVVIWNKRPGLLLRKWGMLVLDTLMGHLTPEMKTTITGSCMNTDMVMPGGVGITSQLQVLDVVMNKRLKSYIKQLCSEWLLTEDHGLTPAGRIKKPSMILCQCIITTWLCMSPEVIVKALNSSVYPVQWMGLIICCGMSVKRMRMLALSVR